MQAKRIAPDGTLQKAASHLEQFCKPMSHKKDARLIWVKFYEILKTPLFHQLMLMVMCHMNCVTKLAKCLKLCSLKMHRLNSMNIERILPYIHYIYYFQNINWPAVAL